jgi:hypothetical protein
LSVLLLERVLHESGLESDVEKVKAYSHLGQDAVRGAVSRQLFLKFDIFGSFCGLAAQRGWTKGFFTLWETNYGQLPASQRRRESLPAAEIVCQQNTAFRNRIWPQRLFSSLAGYRFGGYFG